MRRTILVSLTALVALGLIDGVAIGHVKKWKSSSTVTLGEVTTVLVEASGEIFSPKGACEKERTIEFSTGGRGTSKSNGEWYVLFNTPGANRTVEVEVLKKPLRFGNGHRHVCRAYRTSIEVPPAPIE